MNQQSPDMLPSAELPNPQQQVEQGIDYAASLEGAQETVTAKHLEQGVSAPQVAPPTSSSDPVSIVTAKIAEPHDAPPTGVSGIAVMPQIAEDNDLIEKEWVEKAKQIVEHTKLDPHLQSREMNNMKADYLKKRYNKDLKLGD